MFSFLRSKIKKSNVQKGPVVYLLIKSMSATEKAYFKKYAFKRKNGSSNDYSNLFDLLDKHKNFDIGKISSSNKLSVSFTKKINAHLNQLNKKIIASLLDYRKGKSDISQFLIAMEEYELFKDKGLEDEANRTIKKLEKFSIEKDLFHLKPYLYYTHNMSMLNDIKIDPKIKQIQNNKYTNSIEMLYNKAQLIIASFDFSLLVNKNKSIIFKSKENLKELEKIRIRKEKLLVKLKDDFGSICSLSNNLMIISLNKTNYNELLETVKKFINFYTIHYPKSNDREKLKAIIFLKNASYYLMAMGKTDVYRKTIGIIEEVLLVIKDKHLKEEIQSYYATLKALFYYLNPKENIAEKELIFFKEFLKNSNENSPAFMEILTCTSIILCRQKKYQESIAISDLIFHNKKNYKSYDNNVALRFVRVIAWLKMENIELFSSEIISLYKYLVKTENQNYSKHFVNFIKKFSKTNNNIKKQKLLKNLIADFNKIVKEKSIYEKMEANELKLILELALNS